MDTTHARSSYRKFGPWLAVIAILVLSIYLLRWQGRMWICSCGYVLLWAGNTESSDNSQHLFDPYSFTHVLHGFIFCGLLLLLAPRLAWRWQIVVALAIESLWEVVENSAFIIDRYRTATLALGYQGDTIVNSVSDILCCGLGLLLARRLGFRRSCALFVLTEIVLIIWIKDSLILNIVMLIYPVEAIKRWQMGHT